MVPEEDPPKGILNQAFTHEENGTPISVSPSSPEVYNGIQKKSIARLTTTPFRIQEDSEGTCGWGYCRPNFLQRFRSSRWVLFWLCWGAAVQGMVINGFFNVCITTIEKRYSLRSASSGLIAGSYDLGCVLCSIPVSYLGSLPGASKPRWLGWGILIMGIGSFVFAIPHFTAPYFEIDNSEQDLTTTTLLCIGKRNASLTCQSASEKWMSNYQWVFILGQFLHGIGASPLYTLGVTYLDESVPMKMSSYYLGIFHAMAVLGPAAGYIIGGQLLNIYIDAPNVNPTIFGITIESDQWLGAWWIGFVISGVLAISLSWILMAFPAEIPGAKERAIERLGAESHVGAKSFANLRDLPEATKVLIKNLPFIFISLAQACDGIIVSGFSAFMPKLFESQFGLSAGFASILVGCIAVPAGGGGTFLGGWLVKRFQMKCETILKLCVGASIVSCISGFFLLFSCPEVAFAGVNVDFNDRSKQLFSPTLISTCNTNCHCDNVEFDPVCGSNKVMYYSPCHAGCSSKSILGTNKVYNECECIKSLPATNTSQPLYIKSGEQEFEIPQYSAARQKCPSTCTLLPFSLIIFLILMLVTFVITMPSMSGTLRCVPDTHRSLALGLQGIQIRVFGTIPGPILFGYVLDNACSLWQTSCGETGSCRHYDNHKMSNSLAGVSVVFKGLCTLFFFLSWWFYKKRNLSKSTLVMDITVNSEVSSTSNK